MNPVDEYDALADVFCVDRLDIPPVDWRNWEPKPIDWDRLAKEVMEDRPYVEPVFILSPSQYEWLVRYCEAHGIRRTG